MSWGDGNLWVKIGCRGTRVYSQSRTTPVVSRFIGSSLWQEWVPFNRLDSAQVVLNLGVTFISNATQNGNPANGVFASALGQATGHMFGTVSTQRLDFQIEGVQYRGLMSINGMGPARGDSGAAILQGTTAVGSLIGGNTSRTVAFFYPFGDYSRFIN
jgi:hypothetical protein